MVISKPMEGWEDRVGSDPWRNLIAEECAAVSKPDDPETDDTDEHELDAADIWDWPAPFCYRSFRTEAAPPSRSYLVFQVGRFFLVGAPTGIAPEGESQTPLHLVLLTAEEKHTAGLNDIIEKFPKLTIWTSSWIWEEVRRPAKDQIFKYLTPNEAEDQFGRAFEEDERRLVVLWDRELSVDFTLGTRLHMYYVPSHSPALAATFLCNQLQIQLDQSGALERTELAEIEGRLQERLASLPSLLPEFVTRYGVLRTDHQLLRTKGKEIEEQSWQIPQRPLIKTVPREAIIKTKSTEEPSDFPSREILCDQNGQRDSDVEDKSTTPVDVDMLNKRCADLAFTVEKPPLTAPLQILHIKENSSSNEAGEILANTAFAVLCGGLRSKLRHNLLDPSRRLDFSIPSGEEQQIAVKSILEWRLRQIARLAKDHRLKTIPVLIITTPDTEDTVEEEIRNFYLACPNGARLRIYQLPQTLAPTLKARDQDHLQPIANDDGGWSLNSRGHLDMARLLYRWFESDRNQDPRRFCVCFKYNNLGDIVNEKTLNRLLLFRESHIHLAVELFKFDRGREATQNEPRFAEMSFLADRGPQKGSLVKEMYFEKPGASWPTAYCSSHTWYIDILKIRKLVSKTDDANFSNRYIFSQINDVAIGHENANEKPNLHVRQDLEQLTYCEGVHTGAFIDNLGSSRKPGEPEPPEMYRHLRFLVVQTEEQIRNAEFRRIFRNTLRGEEYDQSSRDEEDDQSLRKDAAILESVPVERRYVWGGNRIRTLKGQPGKGRIAETWEVSTHPAGTSSVYRSLRHRIPLSVIFDEELPFMIKYLDCHKPLSLQVHPTSMTAKYLEEHIGAFEDSFGRSPAIQDGNGKEESFFVLHTAAHSEENLFLGFNRKELTSIANAIRPALFKHACGSRDSSTHLKSGRLDDSASAGPKGIDDHCYRDILTVLYVYFNKKTDLLSRLADALDMPGKKIHRALLAPFDVNEEQGASKEEGNNERTKRNGDSKPCSSIQDKALYHVLKYHIEVMPALSARSSGSPSARNAGLSLLGKEYLFAAISILAVIERLRNFLTNEASAEIRQRGEALFEYRKEKHRSLLLKYFRRVQVKAGYWVRVPPGVVHAWQGGGNFLIELAQRSDNTFRVLDFGRELSKSNPDRQIHYWEAMYSLTTASILSEEAAKRLIVEDAGLDEEQRCHAMLSSVRDSIDPDDWIRLKPAGRPCSVVLNPDNEAWLQDASGGEWLSVPPCRSVVIKEGTAVKIRPRQRDDRIFHIIPRRKKRAMICIDLGATKLEVALFLEGGSPETIWRTCRADREVDPKLPESAGAESASQVAVPRVSLSKTFGVLAENAEVLFRRAASILYGTGGAENSRLVEGLDRIDLAVAWPGHIQKFGGSESDRLYTTSFNCLEDVGKNKEEEEHGELGYFEKKKVEHRLHDEIIKSFRSHFGVSQAGVESRDWLGDTLFLNDADAAALGESTHPLGALPGQEPGMILNIGSGICCGFFDPRKSSVDRRTANWLSALGAVGRWLYVNPLSGIIGPFNSEELDGNICSKSDPSRNRKIDQTDGQLIDYVFRERGKDSDGQEWPPYRVGNRVRTSLYLSSRGIVSRFLLRLSKEERQAFLERVGGVEVASDFNSLSADSDLRPIPMLLQASRILVSDSEVFDPHRLVIEINSLADTNACEPSHRVARNLIFEFAQELGDIIAGIGRRIEEKSRKDGGYDYYRRCLNRVVLTGTVGQIFGLLPSGDLLLEIMNRVKSPAADETARAILGGQVRFGTVARSEIAVSAIRQTEGFRQKKIDRKARRKAREK